MSKPRHNHSAAFEARVALEGIRSKKTLAQIAAQHELRANQMTTWKAQALEILSTAFTTDASGGDSKAKIHELRASRAAWMARVAGSTTCSSSGRAEL